MYIFGGYGGKMHGKVYNVQPLRARPSRPTEGTAFGGASDMASLLGENQNELADKQRPDEGLRELALFAGAGGGMEWNGGGRHAFWSIPKIEGEHPTTKPLPLVLSFINLFNPEDGRVIDPFLGSGTTLVACKKLGIRGVGIEKEEKYAEIAVKRIKNTTPTLFEVAR